MFVHVDPIALLSGPSMVSGRQIRQARKLLCWNVAALSGMAEVRADIVQRAERADGTPSITLAQAARIRAACEAAGVEFGIHGAVTIRQADWL